MPLRGTHLSFGGPAVFLPLPVAIEEEPDPSSLEIRIDARATFRVVLANPVEADEVRILTADGGVQPVFVQVEESRLSVASVPVVDGVSSVAFTRSGRCQVVLLRDGEEVRREDVVLRPGGLADVEV